ncbi:MAG: hypothetical protein A2175_02055 [Candidatus Nealsonbacteria bacterium RBG_13_42_11]|uniref:Uncharacterized protein n=1 Tax=Candidatus Nealsonbacteria bacterium RBG_13_42_11 TaxID=1801663 RepID=A0A1G2DZX0_9BACT|nr:MAG: hypothetical protein A2175_02055 [Candidatus Nealsonbacteria bacterium RBG_13_42_11]
MVIGTSDYKPEVKVVERQNGRVLNVTIEYWPFKMIFARKGNKKVSLISFRRYDESRDEPDWVPPMYFNPAIKVARGIFSSEHG